MAAASQSIEEQLQEANQTLQPQLLGLNVALIVLTSIVVGLRFLARRLSKLSWSYDDYAILAALVCILPGHAHGA